MSTQLRGCSYQLCKAMAVSEVLGKAADLSCIKESPACKLKNACMATHGGGHSYKMLYTPSLMDGLTYSVGTNPGYSVPAGPMLLTHGGFPMTLTHRRGHL